jgi:hypothetical protein
MANNTIPPITDPLGKGWRQPSLDAVLIDDSHALMDQNAFDGLYEYSASVPTCVYPGKMWKCKQAGIWWLRWFGESDDPSMCSNHHRRILIV